MTSEITEEKEQEEEGSTSFISKEDEKKKIRQILEYQKSLYSSSSSICNSQSSSPAVSFSAVSSANRSGRLLELMKIGNTSLRRLFEMEHTSLAAHFHDYSGSPVTKTIPLWGSSETDGEIYDPWAEIRRSSKFKGIRNDGISNFASGGGSLVDDESAFENRKMRIISSSRLKLTRKKSFRRLPGFFLWRFRKFGFRLRLRRLRIFICGKVF